MKDNKTFDRCKHCGSSDVEQMETEDTGLFFVTCNNCDISTDHSADKNYSIGIWNSTASPWIEIKSDDDFELGKEYLCFFPSRIDAEGRTINESILVQEFNKDRNNKFGLGTMHFVDLDKDTGKTYFGFGIYHDKPTHYMPIPEIK